jgi:uncharacterized membrane protein YphA (DoxX/SURF4 family)
MSSIDPAGDSAPVWLPSGDAPAPQTRTPVRRFDDGMVSPNGRDQALAVRQETAERAEVNRLAAWGLASVLVLSGYEWLISGLDKLFSAEYRGGLAGELSDAMDGNPNHWYVRFLANDVIPHARAYAAVIEWSELLVALGLFLGAATWIGGDRISRRWTRFFHLAACGALLGSAFMTANYYFMEGNRFPWLNTAAPFDEGLSIDGYLALVSLALLAIHLLALRATFARRNAATATAPAPSRVRSARQAA